MNRILLCSSLRRLMIVASAFTAAMCSHAISFNVTPASTSNTYNGFITLQVNGLSTGETVVIRKYLDLNTNGVVDSSDYFVQQCQLQDGQGPTVIGGATNINIPYDHGVADGSITTTIPMAGVGVINRFAAQYFYVVSSPSNHFAAITNTFQVINPPTGQTITGSVLSNSTPVPYAAVLIGTVGHDFNPITGTVANSAGVYSIDLAPGTYMAVALQNNYIGIPSDPFDVTSGTPITNDLSVVGANATISGQVVDSANATIPLVGLLMSAEGNGFAASVTDQNGNFSLAVTAGSQWKISGEDGAWRFLGYVSSNNNLKINVSGNVSGLQLSYPKGDALFYGHVLDSNNQPLAGVHLSGQNANGSGLYQGNASTDINGEYAMAVIDGNWDIGVDTGSLEPELAGYIFSQAPYAYSAGGNGTNLAPNSAVHQDFLALLATNTISGHLRDSSNNGISGVQVFANAIINGINFSAQATTDSSGFYSMNVGNGSWNVSVNCCNGCDNGLPSGYQCPNSQNVNVNNNNQAVDFTAATYTTFISGRVSDEFGNPLGNMNIFAIITNNGGFYGATTDNGGMFTLGLVGGSYTIQLNTDPQSGVASLGLVSPFIPITLADNVSVSNFNVVAQHITGTIMASVTNSDASQPVSGVNVFANITVNGTNYSSGTQMTDANGLAALQVFNGIWSVGLDCSSLGSQNLSCANNQNATVSSNSVGVTFFVHGGGVSPPQLSLPARVGPSRFQFHLNGAPGQNYSIQYATALTNWSTFLVTNPSSPDIIILDSNATSPTRAYRAIGGP